MDRLLHLFQKPGAPLVPWVGIAMVLLVGLVALHKIEVVESEQQRERLEKDWVAARQLLAHHREARKARQDLSRVWAMLPDEHDFAPLALGISEEAKRDRVTLPALSSKTEPTLVPHTSKGLLQGSMSGRYEDLRRFIYDLESAEEPLFIEDLELVRSTGRQDQNPMFNIKIVTYLRGESENAQGQAPLK